MARTKQMPRHGGGSGRPVRAMFPNPDGTGPGGYAPGGPAPNTSANTAGKHPKGHAHRWHRVGPHKGKISPAL